MKHVVNRVLDSTAETSEQRKQRTAQLLKRGINTALRRPWSPGHPLVKLQLRVCVRYLNEKSPCMCSQCGQALVGQRNPRDVKHPRFHPGWSVGVCMGCGHRDFPS